MRAYSWDKYLRIHEETTQEIAYKFYNAMVMVYVKRYFQKPTVFDIHQLYMSHEYKHGFPGILGSIDCIH